jgi:hypothetical protein
MLNFTSDADVEGRVAKGFVFYTTERGSAGSGRLLPKEDADAGVSQVTFSIRRYRARFCKCRYASIVE